jgi:hypothetical protein
MAGQDIMMPRKVILKKSEGNPKNQKRGAEYLTANHSVYAILS